MLAAEVVTLPKKRGFDAAGEREAELGVAVEASVDHVVVQLDVRIPEVHELREVRERETLQRGASSCACRPVGHDLGDHLFEARAVGRRLAHDARGVLLSRPRCQVTSVPVRLVSSSFCASCCTFLVSMTCSGCGTSVTGASGRGSVTSGIVRADVPVVATTVPEASRLSTWPRAAGSPPAPRPESVPERERRRPACRSQWSDSPFPDRPRPARRAVPARAAAAPLR